MMKDWLKLAMFGVVLLSAGVASADRKTAHGSGCDAVYSQYGGTPTYSVTRSPSLGIWTDYPTSGYTTVYCPILRDNTSAAIRDVWVDFTNGSTNGQTTQCHVSTMDRSGSSYVYDSESSGSIASGTSSTVHINADTLSNYNDGAYLLTCTMNSGDRLYNYVWDET